jgi:hypothetical protein
MALLKDAFVAGLFQNVIQAAAANSAQNMEEDEYESLFPLLMHRLEERQPSQSHPGRGKGLRAPFNLVRPVMVSVADYANDQSRFRRLTRFAWDEFSTLVGLLSPAIGQQGRNFTLQGVQTRHPRTVRALLLSSYNLINRLFCVELWYGRGAAYLQDLELLTGWDKSSLTSDFHWLNLIAASVLAPKSRGRMPLNEMN